MVGGVPAGEPADQLACGRAGVDIGEQLRAVGVDLADRQAKAVFMPLSEAMCMQVGDGFADVDDAGHRADKVGWE
jgi:hypothetical protein